MDTKRMIQFETTSDQGAERVSQALDAAFAALAKAAPEGVRLAYWRVSGGRRFTALIDLAYPDTNPLMDVDAVEALPGIIGECVLGGYPRPETVEQVGSYGFQS